MKLRGSIYWVALIVLLAGMGRLPCSATGTVGITAWTEAVGSGPAGPTVCVGCDIKIVVYAYDCDEYDCTCCSDDLEFPDWPLVEGPPSKVGSVYRGEYIINVTDVGDKEFVFKADDKVACPEPYLEDDYPGECHLTIKGVIVSDLVGPTEPICPGTDVEFHVTMSPDNIGASLLTWTGGEDGTVDPQHPSVYHAMFNSPGTYDVSAKCGDEGMTVHVEVQEPLYDVTFLDPVGVVGGKVPVRVQVRTRCAHQVVDGGVDPTTGVIIERYDTDCENGWCAVSFDQIIESDVPENGLNTRVYRSDWNTLQLKNGSCQLRARAFFRFAPDYDTQVNVTETRTVDVLNLSVTSADPEGVIAWKGEEFEDEALTVHLEDNDLTDPITLVFSFLSTARDNSMGWEPDQPVTVTKTFPDGLGGGSFTLHLNSGEWTVAPGLYTFEVEAIQTDICNSDPTLQIEDRAKYRSEHLNLFRGFDPELGPIYEAEYFGYDDKGTTEEDDDDFLYFIRLYRVSSYDPICGSAGEVQIYDPTLTMVYSCPIAGLQCLNHPTPDGLCNGYHAIVIPIPVNKMPPIGTYRFLLHVKDDHGEHYRNGEARWALDLNANTSLRPIEHFSVGAFHVTWCRAEAMNIISKKLIDAGKTSRAARNWVVDNTESGRILAAVNGGFFTPGSIVPIGDWSAGTWKDGDACIVKRWSFSMDERGSSFIVSPMVQKGTTPWKGAMVPKYVAREDVKAKRYGLANVGLLVDNGSLKSVQKWPEQDKKRARTAIGWTTVLARSHFFLVTAPEDSATWSDVCDFFKNGGPLLAELYKRIKYCYVIDKAIMLDGGGSTEQAYRAKTVRGSVVEDCQMPSDGRRIPTIIGVQAEWKQ